MPENIATEVAAIIEAFSAEQRAAALAENTRVKVVLARSLPGASAAGAGQLVFETVFDQAAAREEIDALLDRAGEAVDRQEAKTMIEGHLRELRMAEGLLQRQRHDLAKKEVEFRHQNDQRNEGRRVAITLSAQQAAALSTIRTGIEETEASIAERRLSIDECRRIINGQSRLAAIEETMRRRAEPTPATAA